MTNVTPSGCTLYGGWLNLKTKRNCLKVTLADFKTISFHVKFKFYRKLAVLYFNDKNKEQNLDNNRPSYDGAVDCGNDSDFFNSLSLPSRNVTLEGAVHRRRLEKRFVQSGQEGRCRYLQMRTSVLSVAKKKNFLCNFVRAVFFGHPHLYSAKPNSVVSVCNSSLLNTRIDFIYYGGC